MIILGVINDGEFSVPVALVDTEAATVPVDAVQPDDLGATALAVLYTRSIERRIPDVI